ncbi:MAG: hypothetical protein Q7T05_01240 [Dehalococcoidia bacterium]|nr:hypothetical protein [Dehalococcoidia bacterium]
MQPKYVPVVNNLNSPNKVRHSLLPNGEIVLAPGEVYPLPAKVWSVKFRQTGLRRATPDDEAAWLGRRALVMADAQEIDDMPELEETRLDALKDRAEELGLKLKGNKAEVILQLRAGLLGKMVADHKAAVLETIAQGAYEADRAAQFKEDPQAEVPSWKDAWDEARAEAIANAQVLEDGDSSAISQVFRRAAQSLIAATIEDQPIEAEEGV